MHTINISLNNIDKVKRFVDKVKDLDCDIDLIQGRYVIDGKSIMGIFSIDLTETLQCVVRGDGADRAMKAIEEFAI